MTLNLPEPSMKPGKPYEHINEDEYHSLYEWDTANEQDQ